MRNKIIAALIIVLAFLLIGSTTPVFTETPTPPLATPTVVASSTHAPATNEIFPTVTFNQMLSAFLTCTGLFIAFGKLFIDLRVIKPKGFNVSCLIFGLLFACISLFGFIDISYLYLSCVLIFGVFLANIIVNYVLKKFVITSPEKLNAAVDNLKLKLQANFLELQIKKISGENKELQGNLNQAIGKHHRLEALLEEKNGLELAFNGSLEKEKANVEIAYFEISKLKDDNAKLINEFEAINLQLEYAKIRANKLAEVDNAFAGIHLMLSKNEDIEKGIINTLKTTVVNKIREMINSYLTERDLNEFVPTVSIFKIKQKGKYQFGFEVLAATDLDTDQRTIVENEFSWNTRRKNDNGTQGIASKCIKEQKDYIFIPDLSALSDKDKKIWVQVSDGELRGMLICIAIVMNDRKNEYGPFTKDVLGIVNVTAPIKGTGNKNATYEEIRILVSYITNLIYRYMPNLCSLIYLYQYATNSQ